MINEVFKYGAHWDSRLWHPAAIELKCFVDWWDESEGALGRYQHFRRAINELWPEDVTWNPWMEWRAMAFCDPNNWHMIDDKRVLTLGQVGCAASGKTHDWALFGLVWWLADPLHSAFAMTSIEKQMIRQRSWNWLSRYWHALPSKDAMNMVDSQTKVQSVDPGSGRKSDLNSCFALAVGKGETAKARQRLAGLHTKRIMLVVDEAGGTPEAIYEVIPNMQTGCKEFVFVVASNAESRMDPHGRVCEPKDGWGSIDQNTKAWETRGVPEWQIAPGVCQHFSGRRSPNVQGCANLFPGLYPYDKFLANKGNENTLGYWTYDEGFWPPEGLSDTVFDEATIQNMDAMGKFEWAGRPIAIAALDPAYGGDDCVLRFGEIGEIGDGRKALQIGERYVIRFDTKKPIDIQIAEQVIKQCEKRSVTPENFGLDVSGRGTAVASILGEMWQPLFVKVEFGGYPSATAVAADDGTLAKDKYDRKVTQLWFNARRLLVSGQMKGLDRITSQQFCKRTYEEKSKKIRIEEKGEYKKRLNHSPDDADAVVVLVEVALNRGLSPKRLYTKRIGSYYERKALEINETYDSDEPDTNEEGFGEEVTAWMEDE